MDNRTPFEIRLSVIEGPRLRAVLKNRSSKEQTLLHDVNLQPSKLVLVNASDQVIDPFDTRSIKKYNATVYRSAYVKLAPGEEKVLHTEGFKSDGKGGYELRWGPYEFEHLKPGTYTAQVTWKSEIDTWDDPDSGQQGRMEGIWLGSMASNKVKVSLP